VTDNQELEELQTVATDGRSTQYVKVILGILDRHIAVIEVSPTDVATLASAARDNADNSEEIFGAASRIWITIFRREAREILADIAIARVLSREQHRDDIYFNVLSQDEILLAHAASGEPVDFQGAWYAVQHFTAEKLRIERLFAKRLN
jgi:hypothetical protein